MTDLQEAQQFDEYAKPHLDKILDRYSYHTPEDLMRSGNAAHVEEYQKEMERLLDVFTSRLQQQNP